MKISFEAGLVILLFIVVIFYANYGGSSYVPYAENNMFSRMYPYEGFTDFPSKVSNAADVNGAEQGVQEGTKGQEIKTCVSQRSVVFLREVLCFWKKCCVSGRSVVFLREVLRF